MGFMVTREDPDTGLDREYYKGDDGLLYNDYDHALSERSSDPAIDQIVDTINTGVEESVLGTSESTEDYYNRQGMGDRFGTAPIDTSQLDPVRDVVKGTYTGVDSRFSNVFSDPHPVSYLREGKDWAIKALPGNQRYVPKAAQRVGKAESFGKKHYKNATSNKLESTVHHTVGKLVDDAKEQVAELGARQIARTALGAGLKRFAAGQAANAATGGLLTPAIMTASIYDGVDTAQSMITGKAMHHHAMDAYDTTPEDVLARQSRGTGWSDGGIVIRR